jgi:hypothetical protein
MVQGIASIDATNQQPKQQQALPPDALAALGKGFSSITPEEINGLRRLSDDLKDFSPDKLKVFEQILVFLKKNSDRYDQAVKLLVTKKILEPGDLPPHYMPEFFGILETMVNQAMSGGSKKFAKGGIAQIKNQAQKLQAAGTGGDKILAHINPREAAMLQATRGGGRNPTTGLPEFGFFDDIGNFLKQAAPVILPVALNFLVPGLGAIASGAIGSGIGALINGASPGDALKSAAMGGLGGALISGVSGMMQPGGTFMGGVQAGLPGAAPYNPAAAAITKPVPTNALTSTTAPMSVESAAAAGTPAVTNPAVASNVAAAAKPGFFDKVNDFVKTNPLPALGIAGLGGAAIGSALTPQPQVTPVSLPTGPTAQMVADARFAPGTFDTKTVGPVTAVPTTSPAYPNFRSPFIQSQQPLVQYAAAQGGRIDARIGGHLHGPGTGVSDSIPAKLSDGEFVMTARAVRGAGDGDREAGARKMYQLMHQFEKRA